MYLAVLILVALLAIAALWLLREPVLRGQTASWLRPFYLWIAPPSDLFARVPTGNVDLSKPGTLEFDFTPSYIGDYEVGILVERKVEMPKRSYDFGARGTIAAQSSEGRWTQPVGENPLPWWSAASNGFTLATFVVPRDMPVGHPSRFVLRIDTASPSFHSGYGKATMYVAKRPEK